MVEYQHLECIFFLLNFYLSIISLVITMRLLAVSKKIFDQFLCFKIPMNETNITIDTRLMMLHLPLSRITGLDLNEFI